MDKVVNTRQVASGCLAPSEPVTIVLIQTTSSSRWAFCWHN
jgi:hypothetical protein